MPRDTTFAYSFLVLPPAKRQAIVALWDFLRAVDDAVDVAGSRAGGEPGPIAPEVARRRLDGWRSEVARLFEPSAPRTPQGRALQPYVVRFALPRRAFEAVIEGVAMDIEARRYATFAELREYCLRVASAVGLMCLEIFGYQNGRARRYATELGIALQLTNIIRDLRIDLGRGRLYVPLEDLARFGCAEADLATGVASERVRALVRYQCERARRFYRRAAAALPREDRRRLVAAEIMRATYFALLRRIERARYDVFSRVMRLSHPHRLVIAASAWLKTMSGL